MFGFVRTFRKLIRVSPRLFRETQKGREEKEADRSRPGRRGFLPKGPKRERRKE